MGKSIPIPSTKLTNTFQTRPFTNTTTKMSFSNADTGSKNADPYKATNKDETSIQEKVEDLSEFVKACKFGMITTRDGSSGALVSRCMALAAQETGGIDLIFHTNTESGRSSRLGEARIRWLTERGLSLATCNCIDIASMGR